MEARIAVLEQIASDTRDSLKAIRDDIRGLRADLTGETKSLRLELSDVRKDQRTDFRTTFGAIIALALGLAGLMAHGFKWL